MRAALSLIALAWCSEAAADEGRKLALVVGINRFADDQWPALAYAEKDASDVAAALRPEFDQVMTVEGIVTKARILGALAALSRSSTSDLDTIVLYFSTHGTLGYDEKGELIQTLVLHDTTKDDPVITGLPYRELIQKLAGMRAKKKLVILAACHSGAGKSKLDEELAAELRSLKAPFFPEPEVESEGQVVLAASAFGETAREDSKLENDIYTHFLLQALRQEFDLDDDGAISALEAHDFARRATMAFTDGRQRPTLTAEIIGADPILLRGSRVRSGRPVIAAFGRVFAGATLEVDGHAKGVLPGAYVVDHRAHRVQVTRPNASEPLIDREIDAKPGAVFVLDDLLRKPETPWSVLLGGGYQFVRSSVARTHLPGFFVAAAGAERALLETGDLRLRFSLAGTRATQTVRVPSGNGEIRARQDLSLVLAAIELSLRLFEMDWFFLAANIHAGWAIGRREVDLDTLADSDQLVSYGHGGTSLEATFWALDWLGVRVRSSLTLMVLRVDTETRPVFGDQHALSLVARF